MSVTYIYPPLDANPTNLYDDFKTYMQANIPGWVPYSGELDDWLARAFTAIAAQLTEITSDVATSIFRYFGAFVVGFPPFDALPASSTITIVAQDSAGYTIPAFTQMSFPDATGVLQGFETLTATVIAPASTTAPSVTVQAMTPGSAGNGCTGAGDLDGSTPLTFLSYLTLNSPTTGGVDAEDDQTYLNRLASLFTTLTPSPITASDFTTIAEDQAGVGRAYTLGGFNPATFTLSGNTHTTTTIDTLSSTANIAVGCSVTGSGVPANNFVTAILSGTSVSINVATTTSLTGTTLTFGGQLNQGGFVTTWVTDDNGIALSTPNMNVIQAVIQAECLANVVFGVQAPTSTTVNVTTAVVAWPGHDPTNIQGQVSAALTNALSPSVFGKANSAYPDSQIPGTGWLNDNKVRVVMLENVIMNIPGVHYVNTLTINGGSDLALGGIVPLPAAGTMTVTVTNG